MGPLRDEILAGETKRAMIIGKGSLFLGRMTNLFDGISFVVEANDGSGADDGQAVDEKQIKSMIGQAMKMCIRDRNTEKHFLIQAERRKSGKLTRYRLT